MNKRLISVTASTSFDILTSLSDFVKRLWPQLALKH